MTLDQQIHRIKDNKDDFAAFVICDLNKQFKRDEYKLVDVINRNFDMSFPFKLTKQNIIINIIALYIDIKIDFTCDNIYYHSLNQFMDDKHQDKNLSFNAVKPYGPAKLDISFTISNKHESVFIINSYGDLYFERNNVQNVIKNWDVYIELMKNGSSIVNKLIENYSNLYE